MVTPRIFNDPPALDRPADVEHLLASWHGATLRLEQTHEALRQAVCHMGEELKARNRDLARRNRLADLGHMASHVVQEVHDSLAPVVADLGVLRQRVSHDPVSADLLEKIEGDLQSLDSTLGDLLNFTSDHDPKLQWVTLRHVVDSVCASLAPRIHAQEVEAVVDVPRHLAVLADRKMLRCAMLNLALNALDAMPDGGRLVVTSFIGRHGLELEVADSGRGLSDDVMRHAFEPFFTTKSSGTGLGLAIVHRIAESHGGSVVAVNCPEGGAAFTLRFPQRALQSAA